MNAKQSIGKSLKAFRISKGFAQSELESDPGHISGLENARRPLTAEKLENIAQILGVHPLSILLKGYLLDDERVTLEGLFQQIRHEIESLSEASARKSPLR
ncbi:MAG: hypothetical protein GAK45_01614 [Pseudomonas citronellolis]|nr:MAG: hypothetical protein GAK45_01614 [Pseudomonas citronellolis]